jgi:hypothetical protein
MLLHISSDIPEPNATVCRACGYWQRRSGLFRPVGTPFGNGVAGRDENGHGSGCSAIAPVKQLVPLASRRCERHDTLPMSRTAITPSATLAALQRVAPWWVNWEGVPASLASGAPPIVRWALKRQATYWAAAHDGSKAPPCNSGSGWSAGASQWVAGKGVSTSGAAGSPVDRRHLSMLRRGRLRRCALIMTPGSGRSWEHYPLHYVAEVLAKTGFLLD